jgi:hypothetical protein
MRTTSKGKVTGSTHVRHSAGTRPGAEVSAAFEEGVLGRLGRMPRPRQ